MKALADTSPCFQSSGFFVDNLELWPENVSCTFKISYLFIIPESFDVLLHHESVMRNVFRAAGSFPPARGIRIAARRQ